MKQLLYIILAVLGVSLLLKGTTSSSGAAAPWSLFGNGQNPIPGSATLFRPIYFQEQLNNQRPGDPYSGPGGFTDPSVVAGGNTIDARFNPAAAVDQFSPLYGG